MNARSSADKSSEAKQTNTARPSQHETGSFSAASPHASIMLLQRTRGNRAVQRLYEAGHPVPIQRQTPLEEEEPVCAKALQRQPVEEEEELKTTSAIQPKLTLSRPGDVHEQEAEQVAEEVSTFSNSFRNGGLQPSLLSQLSVPRVMGLTGVSPKSFQNTTHSGRKLQIFANTAERTTEPDTVSPEIEPRIMQSRGAGSSLPGYMQNVMSLRTGYDFSAVRVKTDSEAADLSRSINARAFTLGSDIWLGKNESPDDVHLMAHELTHVVQQGAATRISTVSTAGFDTLRNTSTVMGYLQSLNRGGIHDASLYREEIERFEMSNPPDQIAELHRQILEKPKGGEIGRSSDSKVMRACGCSGGPGGGSTPHPSYASGTSLGVKPGNTEGWIRGRLGNTATSPEHSFYEYQKVSYDRRDGGRDYFDIQEGPYATQKGSLLPGFLDSTFTWAGGAALTFREDSTRSTSLQSRGTLDYNVGTVEAKIFVDSGTSKISANRDYPLALPDAPHAGGASYGDYAKIWFHIEGGPQSDEYLHRGDRSAGCVSAQGNWPAIFGYLKNKRADDRHVGTIRREIV